MTRSSAATAVAAVLLVSVASPGVAGGLRHGYAVDGDTVRLTSGMSVRVVGIDTPEEGRCGSGKAQRATGRFIRDGFTLKRTTTANTDRYGRRLRYVRDPAGRDLGAYLIRRGLAVARYDSRDGYARHQLQDTYRRLDGQQRNVCGFDPTSDRQPGDGGGLKFRSCDAARSAGAAPIYRGEPGYSARLDADGDGVACE